MPKNKLKLKTVFAFLLAMVFCQLLISADVANAEETASVENEKVISLQKMNIPSKDSELFASANLDAPCTRYDATLLYNLCSGQTDVAVDESYKEESLTQGEMIRLFLQLFDIGAGDDAVASAKTAELIENDDGFEYNESTATYYNLACLTYNCIAYDPTPLDENSELPVFKTLLENKVLDGLGFNGVQALNNQAMLDTFLYGVKKYPYTVMQGGKGESLEFGYVSYFGSTLLRPYFSQQQWSRDGKSFICTVQHTGDNKQYLYVYNTEDQTFRYIDATNTSSGCVMGDDDFVYYARRKREGSGLFEIWKSPIDGSGEPQWVYTFPGPMWVSMLHITNDCKYLSVEVGRTKESAKLYDYPAGTTPIVRVNLEDGTHTVSYYGYNYSNTVNHTQINPVYEDLLFFAHETNTNEGYTYTDVQERASFVDVENGKVTHIAPGLVENSDRAILFFTHESWSYNGEYLYITNLGGKGEYAPINGIVRVNKDGTHRRYYYNNLIRGSEYNGWSLGITHSYPSGDDRYVAIDGNWVYIMSTETNQVFPICMSLFSAKGHPYHPHPIIARHKYVVNWGMVDSNGVLGISWYDFTDIDKTKIATGGRYEFGDCVENVRYYESRKNAPALSCDTKEITYAGKTALCAESGKNIYLDINEDIVDSANQGVKITIDYYDNSTTPLVITYTKGVENDNELCYFENMTKEIPRTGTNSWKTATVVIESGNFEDIGTYGTDFHISGGAKPVYISGIKVENLPINNVIDAQFSSITEAENCYSFTGRLSRSKNTVKQVKLIAAGYGSDGKLVSIIKQDADFGGDSVADFSLLLPSSGEERSVMFYAWGSDNKITPLGEKIEITPFNLIATKAANGVRLTWDEIPDAEEYEVFRDGKRIAVTENTGFDDKYFTVPEQLAGDVMNEYTTPHSYVVKCGNKVSKSVDSSIDTSLIQYVLAPTDTALNFDDAEAEEYVVVVTARLTDTGGKELFSVAIDSDGTMETVPYADLNEEISVFSALMGRTTGVSYKPKSMGSFSVPEKFLSAQTNQDYYAYVFKIKACFGSSDVSNLCFPDNEGITVKSVAFVKSENFIN